MVKDTRARALHRPRRRERLVEGLIGVAFLAAALALGLGVEHPTPLSPATALLLVGAYALAWRVEFEVGTGYTSPTQLVLVPMLFLLPANWVPLLVCASYIVGRMVDAALGRRHVGRALLAFSQSWHAVGPALVLTVAPVVEPSWADWPVLLAALLAQFACDAAASFAADRFGLRVPLRPLVRPALWVYLVDALLAPVGLLAAMAAAGAPLAVLLVMPLCLLLAIFARERTGRLDHALELSRAYRGTAMLLGNVVEGDHRYTGAHSRDVVELAVQVADRLALTPRQRRNVEFGALLHDVGKIAVPKEIIDKPGKLNAQEWEVMKQHTVEGQRMLEAVGGVLGEVGQVVRASHEDFDGTGYPDRLAGDQIPIEARICSCCDAFSAMTTDRAYRKAMSVEVALAEVRAHAGTQFDPRVTAVLVAVIEERDGLLDPSRVPCV